MSNWLCTYLSQKHLFESECNCSTRVQTHLLWCHSPALTAITLRWRFLFVADINICNNITVFKLIAIDRDILNYQNKFIYRWSLFTWNYLTVWKMTLAFNHHHVTLSARISLTLSRHPSLSSVVPGSTSRLYPASVQSCCM